MPWHTKTEGDQVVVVRDRDGKVVGRHPSKEKALAHLRALYASEVVKSAMVSDREEARHQSLVSFLKASFGGDRSAAGRYAAEQRWKGHKKSDASANWNTPTDDLEVAKTTGRPVSWLQWGNLPNQDAFDYYLKTTQDVKEKIKEVENWLSKNGLVTEPYVPPTMEQVMDKRKEHRELINQNDNLESEFGSELEKFREECITRGMTDEEARIAMNGVQRLVRVYENDGDATRSDSQREVLAKDAVKNAEIMIAIPTGALEAILIDGRFKSQFESKRSGGYLGEEMRAGQETFAFGYHPRMNPTLRPIYGYVHNKKIRYSKAMEDARQYGNVHVVLKDGIKDRTTFTSDDSLNQPMIPAPVNKPNKMAVHPTMSFSLYTEAQIHGGVSLSDIEKVVVSVDNYNNSHIAKLLKKAGIPLQIIQFEDLDLEKASFGGDRSAAGRYAAQQRWKGHVKDQPQSPIDRIKAESARVAGLLKQMDQAVGGDGKVAELLSVPVFGTMWTEDDLFSLFESWEKEEGYKLTKMRLPVQRKENGELKTGETWDRKEYYEAQLINMPSPAVFEVEQQVNALGREVLATAEKNLQDQGITRASVDQYNESRDSIIKDATSRLQAVSSLLSFEGRGKENTTGVPIPKELQDLISLRNSLADTITMMSAYPEEPQFIEAKRSYGPIQLKIADAMNNWQPYRDAKEAHEKATQLPKIAPYQTQVYNEVQKMLRETRQMHTVEVNATSATSSSDLADRFKNSIQAVFPSDIIKKVNTNMGTIRVGESGGGGSWNLTQRYIRTDPINDYVDMHEFIHAWSDSSTQVRFVEAALLARRIIGLRSDIGKSPMSAKKMAQGVQPIYQQKTYTSKSGMKYALKFPHIRDEFNDPYAGRLYGNGGAEVLTVGHDFAYTSHQMRSVTGKPFDTDLSATIIGLLFTAERP